MTPGTRSLAPRAPTGTLLEVRPIDCNRVERRCVVAWRGAPRRLGHAESVVRWRRIRQRERERTVRFPEQPAAHRALGEHGPDDDAVSALAQRNSPSAFRPVVRHRARRSIPTRQDLLIASTPFASASTPCSAPRGTRVTFRTDMPILRCVETPDRLTEPSYDPAGEPPAALAVSAGRSGASASGRPGWRASCSRSRR